MLALPLYPESKDSIATAVAAPRSVRLSFTDRCDLACIYCRPHRRDGYVEAPLELDAWKTMARALVASGVRRVRITGGEPLLYGRVVEAVAFLSSLGIDDLALTTNATRLAKLASPLRAAGLQRLNISLDTLHQQRFFSMTRGGDLSGVLRGIEAAGAAGFVGTKLNTVVVRGENDGELREITEWAWARGITPRFLEVMAIGEGAKLADRVVTGREMRDRLSDLIADEPLTVEPERGPARYVRSRRDPHLRVGFITGTSDTYCKGCDRLRVSSDGTFRPCLATSDGVSAADAARAGEEGDVRARLNEAWAKKPDGEIWKGCTEPEAADLSIRSIGG